MTTGKKLNSIKKLFKLPFVIIMMPLLLTLTFFITDWEDEEEVIYNKQYLKDFIW